MRLVQLPTLNDSASDYDKLFVNVCLRCDERYYHLRSEHPTGPPF